MAWDQIARLASADAVAAKLVERGLWVASTAYAPGDVVTANYSRWYCTTAHTAGAVFSPTNWINVGPAIIAAATDPGVPGWLWVKVP
ncbi:carbohydrate-binding protein [Promicromonospora sukumoe]